MALFELPELASWVRQSDMDTASAALCREMATTYLETEVGVSLTQQSGVAVTYTPRWSDEWIDLPIPTTSIASVSVDGTALTSDDYEFVTDTYQLRRTGGWGGNGWAVSERRFAIPYDDHVSVTVTMTYGFATPPGDFRLWGLVLAAQAYQLSPSLNRQSVRIDDFAETFATGGDLAALGIELPPRVLVRFKARYGRGVAVVGAR